MIVKKVHIIILLSSILILFCVRIAHTAPAEQQDSSDFEIVDLCLETVTIINVDSNDTGFILTSNCSSKHGEAFELNYEDADANDEEVIFEWSSASGFFISTDNGQTPVKEVTANKTYWNPTVDVYYLPNGHNVTLTVLKGCSISVTDGVKREHQLSDARKERFTCEGSKKLVSNKNQFSGSHVLSCDLKTRTWEDYDVSCNGPLRCVGDLESSQHPEGCEVWRIHKHTGFNVTCSNANSADEPSFKLQCENRQQVLGFLGGLFLSETGSLEVTCKESSGNKSWVTSTNEIIPPSIKLSCLNRFIETSTTDCSGGEENHSAIVTSTQESTVVITNRNVSSDVTTQQQNFITSSRSLKISSPIITSDVYKTSSYTLTHSKSERTPTEPTRATVDEGNGVAAPGYIYAYWTMLAIHGLT